MCNAVNGVMCFEYVPFNTKQCTQESMKCLCEQANFRRLCMKNLQAERLNPAVEPFALSNAIFEDFKSLKNNGKALDCAKESKEEDKELIKLDVNGAEMRESERASNH